MMREPSSAGELAADSVESDAGEIERNHAREQVRFLLHPFAQGVDIEVAQQRVRRIIKTPGRAAR